MTIKLEEMRSSLISLINYADEQELIALYEQLKNVKITNEGDNYFPCYVVTPSQELNTCHTLQS